MKFTSWIIAMDSNTRLPKPFVAPIERLEPSLCRYRCYIVRDHFPTIGNNTVGEARIL